MLTALTLLGAVSARIVGIAAPSTIAPNSNFTITIITENYIQSVLDISAIFGLTQHPSPGSIGNYLTSTYLGPCKKNTAKYSPTPQELTFSKRNPISSPMSM